jgi:hypothetical protein
LLEHRRVFRRLAEAGEVRHGGIHVAGAHGVADGFSLFQNRLVVLHPAVAHAPFFPAPFLHCLAGQALRIPARDDLGERLAFGAMEVAALFKEKPAEVEVALVAGGAVEFHQSQLDSLMAIDIVAFVRAKRLVDVVGEAFRRIEGFGFAGELVVCHGELEEVAGVVHLVVEPEVGPLVFRLLGGEITDQIAILLLRGDDAVEDALDAPVQGRVVAMAERVARAFKRLVDVGIESAVAGDFAVLGTIGIL